MRLLCMCNICILNCSILHQIFSLSYLYYLTWYRAIIHGNTEKRFLAVFNWNWIKVRLFLCKTHDLIGSNTFSFWRYLWWNKSDSLTHMAPSREQSKMTELPQLPFASCMYWDGGTRPCLDCQALFCHSCCYLSPWLTVYLPSK